MTGLEVDPDPTGIRARTRRAMVRTPAPSRPEPKPEVLAVSFEWTPPGHVDQVAVLQLLRRLRARAGASGGNPRVQPLARRLALLDGLVDGVRTGGPVRLSVKGLDRADRELLFKVFTAGLKHFRGEDDPAVAALEDLVGRWERFTFGPGGFRGDADTKARRLAARDVAQWSTSELTR